MTVQEEHSIIYELVSKKLAEGLSTEEQQQLDELVSRSDEHRKVMDDVTHIWNAASEPIEVDTDTAWNMLSSRIEAEEEVPVVPIQVSSRYRWMGIAASIVLLLGIFVLYRFGGQPEMISYTAGAAEQIILPDGSSVDLHEGATLSYPEAFKGAQREVKLSGTAFFNVTRDTEKPFTIHTDEIHVKVLGTSFYVRSLDNGDMEVNVETGKVQVTDKDNSNTQVTLTADQNARFEKATQRLSQSEKEVNDLFWKTKTLVFRRASLQHVIEVVNRSYKANLSIGNDQLKDCKLTATFKDSSFDEVLEVLKTTFDITVEENDTEWILNGKSCQ